MAIKEGSVEWEIAGQRYSMPPYERMPRDNARLRDIRIEFPRLEKDTAESCPIPIPEIVEYLRRESPDYEKVRAEQLRFLRTARVAEMSYWIWSFRESDGTDCFVTVCLSPKGWTCIGYDSNDYDLTPDQFMLGDYHNVF